MRHFPAEKRSSIWCRSLIPTLRSPQAAYILGFASLCLLCLYVPLLFSVAASRLPASFLFQLRLPDVAPKGWDPTNTRRSPLPSSAVLALQDRIEQFPSISPTTLPTQYLQQHPTLSNNGNAPDPRLAAFHHYSCAPEGDTIGCTASILPCHSPKLNCLLQRRLSAGSLDQARERERSSGLQE